MLQKNETRALLLDATTRGLYEFLCFQATLQGSHEIKSSYQALANSNRLQRSHVKSIIKRLVAKGAIKVEPEGSRGTTITLPAEDPPTQKQRRAISSLRRFDPTCKEPATKEEARLLIRRLLKLQEEEKEGEERAQKLYIMKEGEDLEEVFQRMKEDRRLEEEIKSEVTAEMMEAAAASLGIET